MRNASQVLSKTVILMRWVHRTRGSDRYPITLVKLGRIKINVVAKRISPA
ncbi:hypothetical protein ABID93_003878 [Pseudomonas trivialis]